MPTTVPRGMYPGPIRVLPRLTRKTVSLVTRVHVDRAAEGDRQPRLEVEAVQRVDDVEVFAVGDMNRTVRVRQVYPPSGVCV